MRRAIVGLVGLLLVVTASRAAGDDATIALVLSRARLEVARAVTYDGHYVALTYAGDADTGHRVYPNGDLDPAHGVCTDVVIRALRVAGIDLQSRVHEDVLARPKAYARFVRAPDANIDHRRVGTLTVWFDGHARRLPIDPRTRSFKPGDVVVWSLSGDGSPEHIGIVSDRLGPRGLPMVLHNMGPLPTEDDLLDAWSILGHWRVL